MQIYFLHRKLVNFYHRIRGNYLNVGPLFYFFDTLRSSLSDSSVSFYLGSKVFLLINTKNEEEVSNDDKIGNKRELSGGTGGIMTLLPIFIVSSTMIYQKIS